MRGMIYFAAFAATVPVANWMIMNVGQCHDGGPCLIPVGFGLMAPSGVLVIGAAMVLRDLVHQVMGAKWALAAIMAGAALSAMFAAPQLVVASVLAFLIAELADMAVYSRVRKHSIWLAVLVSGLVGSAIDSAAFLLVAFRSLDFIAGQIVGKVWASIAAAAFLAARPMTHNQPHGGA